MNESNVHIYTNKTALLVIDMQKSLLSESGVMGKLKLDITYLKAVIEPVRKIIQVCRKHGMPIIYARHVLRSDYKDAGLFAKRFPAAKEHNALVAGTWEVEIHERLKPKPGDFIVDKTRYSAFYGTNLEIILRGLKVNSIVMVGATTEICVDATARDAYARDYEVIIIEDAVASVSLERHQGALATAAYGYATLLTVTDFKKLLASA